MEIFNLLFVLFVYYLFYFMEFYQKVLLIFSSCLFVSLLANHKTIEEKSNNPEGNQFFYFILNTFINIIVFLYNFTFLTLNKIKNIYGFSHIYSLLEKINVQYLHGRDTIISYVLQNSMNLLLNPNIMSSNNFNPNNSFTDTNQSQKKSNKLETRAFNDKEEMNNFLDDILNDKKND